MVLDLDRHAFVLGIETRSFGHGPALHGAVQFEAEVVMQADGPVFLDDERQSARGGPAAIGRLRSYREIAFCVVLPQRGGGDNENVSGVRLEVRVGSRAAK